MEGATGSRAASSGSSRQASSRRPGERSTWWLAFASFSALACLSSFSTPIGAGPDEPAHVIKAVAVARGDWTTTVVVSRPQPGVSVPLTTLEVPRAYGALTTARDCYILRSAVPAGCAPGIGDDETVAAATTEAGAYPVLFYLLVGWPSRVLAPEPAIYAMRVVGALLAAALLASGLASATRGAPGRTTPAPAVAGAALAVTPMALYLAGVVNPNGLEVAAAFCLWWALLDLLTTASDPGGVTSVPTRLLVRVVVSAVVVAGMRPLSPAFLAVVVTAVALVALDRRKLRALWADRRVRAAMAVVTVAVVGFVAYVVVNRSYDAIIGLTFADDPSRIELARRSWARSWDRLSQMIGVFGSLDTPLPPSLVTAWVAATAALSGLALVVGRWRERVVMAATLAGCVLLPVVAETISGPRTGLAWQGRYTLTVAVGAPILAGWIVGRAARVPRRAGVTVGAAIAFAAAAGQLVAHVRSMDRYVVGLPSDWLAHLDGGLWAGPVEPAALLVWAIGASAAYAGLLLVLSIGLGSGSVLTGRRRAGVDAARPSQGASAARTGGVG